MLSCLGRLLAVPLIVLAGGAVWSHISTGPPASGPSVRAATPHHHSPVTPADGAIAPPAAAPTRASGGLTAQSIGEMTSGLWHRMNDDTSRTASGQQAIIRELSTAMRSQIDQLLKKAVSTPGR